MEFGKDTAQAMDACTVRLRIPQGTNPVDFHAKVEDLQIDVPSLAKVVIDGRAGVVLFGGDVTINPVSVAVGSLTVIILALKRGQSTALGVALCQRRATRTLTQKRGQAGVVAGIPLEFL